MNDSQVAKVNLYDNPACSYIFGSSCYTIIVSKQIILFNWVCLKHTDNRNIVLSQI